MTWQPIETAPRGAKEILVCLENGDIHVVYGHVYDYGNKFEWAQFDGSNAYNPTHWMPLPEPPEDNSNKVFKCYCGKTEIIGSSGCCNDPDCIPY